jgi:hypothetical protein
MKMKYFELTSTWKKLANTDISYVLIRSNDKRAKVSKHEFNGFYPNYTGSSRFNWPNGQGKYEIGFDVPLIDIMTRVEVAKNLGINVDSVMKNQGIVVVKDSNDNNVIILSAGDNIENHQYAIQNNVWEKNRGKGVVFS